MGDLTKDFNRKEFACKCGCGFDGIDPRVVLMTQQIRDALGEPIRINSGCRCVKHNAAVGSKSTNHTRGKAADLSCASGHRAIFAKVKEMYSQGKLQDLDLCLLEGSWVHIDINGKRKSGVFQTL